MVDTVKEVALDLIRTPSGRVWLLVFLLVALLAQLLLEDRAPTKAEVLEAIKETIRERDGSRFVNERKGTSIPAGGKLPSEEEWKRLNQ